MSTEITRSDSRTNKPLRKQSEIEENEYDDHEGVTHAEQESSPGSDQSDTTIIAGKSRIRPFRYHHYCR